MLCLCCRQIQADLLLVEYDSFLPPVLQRHHQLVLPALQLALAIATGCGSHNNTAARQLQTFLADQREAMKTVLEEATVAPSMTVLQEAHLLVQLMRLVLPVLSDQELVSTRCLERLVNRLNVLVDIADGFRRTAYSSSWLDVGRVGGTRLGSKHTANKR